MSAPQPKPWISAIHPYIPGKASADDGRLVVKLSANENPLGCSPHARAAFAEGSTTLERYPDPTAAALRSVLAETHGLDPARIIYGTGSDEIISVAVGVYAGPGDEILFPRYSFAAYPIATRRAGATPVEAADKDYGTDVDTLLAAVNERTRIVFVANPNNPTGTYIGAPEIARLHAGLPADCLLIVDQAYAEYLEADEDDGALEMARTLPNVLIMRTFSKIHGLAAERIGWGYGPAEVVNALHRIRMPFCLTTAGQRAAIAAVRDTEHVARSRAHNNRLRTWFEGEIANLGNFGLRAVPSKANFSLLLFEGALTGEAAYKGLMERGYVTRWLPNQGMPSAVRITIGTDEDMTAVATALRELAEAAG
ncbi:histidinol-phosphate transaminase [Phenylobacterium sp.]|uniref:histidinol-phosphate transaminase n=1 Tax=Phenylobacterium sp. TaxID=1871053 RepID=UPI00286EB2E9|nr:histidinol-phosphate transaminase [Phenylobacterium sp.]